jgi:hypothetical protein
LGRVKSKKKISKGPSSKLKRNLRIAPLSEQTSKLHQLMRTKVNRERNYNV